MRRTFDEDEDDRDDPLPSDQALGDEADDALDPIACPYCGESISARADVCPRCHSFILREHLPDDRRPRWVVVTIAVLIASLFLGFVSFR